MRTAGSARRRELPAEGSFQEADLSIAQWVADKGRRAGLGSDTLPSAPALYLPLGDERQRLGVLAVLPQNRRRVLLPEQLHLLETFASQIGLALERARLAEATEEARVATESERLRNTLLASISHDLRTPLSVMAAAASTLARSGAALDEPTRKSLANSIEDKAQEMTDLISNVLDLTRLESGQVVLRRDWETLDDLAADALRRLDERARAHQFVIDLSPDLPAVHVDAALIVQVFGNLFDNVVKYTPAGTRARVSAVADGPFVRVTVDDDGPGLPAGDPELLFEKFQRGTDEPATVGVGLGLAICRAIVQGARRRHQGSAPARRWRPLRVHASGDGAGAMTDAMHQVLVVEDEPEIRRILRVLLESESYRVVEAETAARADVEARAHKPDLLIVDLGLPDGNGLDVIRGVRTWSPVPILVLSARTMEDQKIAALDAGADDYVTKPFSAPELLARMRAALRRNVRTQEQSPVLSLGAVTIDLARRVASGPQGEIHVTPLEYRVLECLTRQAGAIVTRDQLMREVWGPEHDDTRNLRVCIKNLRQKLEPDARNPRYLLTETGIGYRFVPED